MTRRPVHANTIHVIRDRGGLGDMVRVAAVLDALAERNPDRPIQFYAPAEYRELVVNFTRAFESRPDITYVTADDRFASLRPRRGEPIYPGVLQNMRINGGQVIDLARPCVVQDRVCARTGELPKIERTELWSRAAGLQHTPTPWIRPVSTGDIVDKDAKPFVVCHGQSAGVIRRWPQDHWHALSTLLQRDGVAVHTIDVTLAWNVLIWAVCRASLVVAVDSGIFHLAAALGRPTLGLFGPTDGALTCACYSGNVNALQVVGGFPNPKPVACQEVCYGWPSRGFIGGPCRHGCALLARLTPSVVHDRAMSMLHPMEAKP